jgi:hypothetical protein
MADKDENSAEQVKRAKAALEALSKETSANKAQPKPRVPLGWATNQANSYMDWVERLRAEHKPEPGGAYDRANTKAWEMAQAGAKQYVQPAVESAEASIRRNVPETKLDVARRAVNKLMGRPEPSYIDLDTDETEAVASGAQATKDRNDEMLRELESRRDSVRRAQKALEDPSTKSWSREQWEQWTAEQKAKDAQPKPGG